MPSLAALLPALLLLAIWAVSSATAQGVASHLANHARALPTAKSKASFHRRQRIPGSQGSSGQPRIAICYTGGMRTFEDVWQSQRDNLFTPLQNAGYDLTVFFATLNGVEHEKDLFTAGRKEVDAMSVRREVGKAVGAAKVKVMLTQDPQLPVDYCERCGNCTDKHRWDQPQRFVSQWARVRECYRMVQSHERAHRHRFDGIFRLRPDMLFVTAVDLSWVQLALGKDTGMKEVRQKELALEQGIVTSPKSASGTSMGDWAAFCRADKCHLYFEMYSAFESCRGGEEAPTVKDPCCNMYGNFYTAVMEAQRWEAAESHLLFPAALVREPPDLAACRRCKRGNVYENVTVPSVTCNRLLQVDTSEGNISARSAAAGRMAALGRNVELCYRVATAKGWIAQYTCELEGSVVVNKRCLEKQPLHLWREPAARGVANR